MGNRGSKKNVEDIVWEMQLKAREIKRLSEKCSKEQRAEEIRVKKAVGKGNRDGARIHAENAIRKKNESLNYLKLSSQFDAVASRLEGVHRSQEMTQGIREAMPKLERLVVTLDANRLTADMRSFEDIFETLDVRSDQLTSAIDATTATSTPQSEVDQLLCKVGEEHALDVSGMLSTAPVGTGALTAPGSMAKQPEAIGVQARLDNL